MLGMGYSVPPQPHLIRQSGAAHLPRLARGLKRPLQCLFAVDTTALDPLIFSHNLRIVLCQSAPSLITRRFSECE